MAPPPTPAAFANAPTCAVINDDKGNTTMATSKSHTSLAPTLSALTRTHSPDSTRVVARSLHMQYMRHTQGWSKGLCTSTCWCCSCLCAIRRPICLRYASYRVARPACGKATGWLTRTVAASAPSVLGFAENGVSGVSAILLADKEQLQSTYDDPTYAALNLCQSATQGCSCVYGWGNEMPTSSAPQCDAARQYY